MTVDRIEKLSNELVTLMRPNSLKAANKIGLLIRQELDREYRRGYTEGIAATKAPKGDA